MKTNQTVYDERYAERAHYWEFKPSSMVNQLLELLPPFGRNPKVLEIGCGEGATALFLARSGYDVTAFDLSSVGVEKTMKQSKKLAIPVKVFQADINEFTFGDGDDYDVIFSSGTLQYLNIEKRGAFIASLKAHTTPEGINVIHTFVGKPFIERAPDAEPQESLWTSGELLTYYADWKTEKFIEEIKPCTSSGVPHFHCHNRIWTRRV